MEQVPWGNKSSQGEASLTETMLPSEGEYVAKHSYKRNMVVGPSSLGNEVPSNELVVKVVKEAAAGESVEAKFCHGRSVIYV